MSSGEPASSDPGGRQIPKPAPSLNAILKGTLGAAENITTIEQGIWNPDSYETFLHSSLQFLEHKLHDRLFSIRPTPSGKVVLTDGFVFAPIFCTSSGRFLDSDSEQVVRVHNFSDDEEPTPFTPRRKETKTSVKSSSIMYSCISLSNAMETASVPKIDSNVRGSNAMKRFPTIHERDNTDRSSREVSVQTSHLNCFPFLTTSAGNANRMELKKEFLNFSDYVVYCNSVSKIKSKYNFGGQRNDATLRSSPTAEKTSPDTSDRTQEVCPRSVVVEDTCREGRPMTTKRCPVTNVTTTRRASPEYECRLQSPVRTLSNATGLTVQSRESRASFLNQSDAAQSLASSKSVHYYARISASFFSFLNRAVHKQKQRQRSKSPKTQHRHDTAGRGKVKTPTETEHDLKYSSSKANMLHRFVSFFSGSKASRNYDQVYDPTAVVTTLIDVRGNMLSEGLDDDCANIDLKQNGDDPHRDERIFQNKSFPQPGRARRRSPTESPTLSTVFSDELATKNDPVVPKLNGKPVKFKTPADHRHFQHERTAVGNLLPSPNTLANSSKADKEGLAPLNKNDVLKSYMTEECKKKCKEIIDLGREVTATAIQNKVHERDPCGLRFNPNADSLTPIEINGSVATGRSQYQCKPELRKHEKLQQTGNFTTNLYTCRRNDNFFQSKSSDPRSYQLPQEIKQECVPGINNREHLPRTHQRSDQPNTPLNIKPATLIPSPLHETVGNNSPGARNQKPNVYPGTKTSQRHHHKDSPTFEDTSKGLVSKPQVRSHNLTHPVLDYQRVQNSSKQQEFVPTAKPRTSHTRPAPTKKVRTKSKPTRSEREKRLPAKYQHVSSSSDDEPVLEAQPPVSNTASASSRSTYWIPNKRVAHNNREITFSKEIIQLYERPPHTSRRTKL